MIAAFLKKNSARACQCQIDKNVNVKTKASKSTEKLNSCEEISKLQFKTTMDTVPITKFELKNKNIYVKLDWKETENELFYIKIFDGDHTWSGRFSNEFAENYREAVHESKEEYYKNIKTALMSNEKCDEYIYDFALVPGETTSATFSWKKKYKAMTRLHGSAPVHQDHNNTDSKGDLIDFLLNENVDLRKTVVDYTKRNQALRIDLDKCKSELESFVNLKTSIEATLYGKFVELLNTKKTRIKQLEDHLNNMHEPNVIDKNLD